MFRKKCIVSVMCITFFLAGCETSTIISATPDGDETLILAPGEEQEFSVAVQDGKYEHTEESWNITNNTPSSTQYPEHNNLTHHGGSLATQYLPGQESPGAYKVRFKRTDYGVLIPNFGEGDLTLPVSTTAKTWNLVVKGIEVLPERSIAMPGEKTLYTAKAYPEGLYAYAWYLDDVPVGGDTQYAFTPTVLQGGLHTLTVTASGDGETFTYSRRIIVPTARIESPESWTEGAFSPGSNGDYYTADAVATGIVNNTVTNLDSAIYGFDAHGQLLWRTQVGGDQEDFLLSLNPTIDGGCIGAGLSYSSSFGDTTNNGESDGYIVRMNCDGEILWQKLIGSSGPDGLKTIRQTSDGGFIAIGSSNEVLWVLKIDGAGLLAWERTIADARYLGGANWFSREAPGVIIENAGAYVAAGGTVILKLDPTDGKTIWRSASIVSDVIDLAPAVDGGYVYVSTPFEDSSHLVKLDEAGGVVWRKAYTSDTDSSFARTISRDSGNGYLVAGRHASQAGVDVHSVISNVKNSAMVMVLDQEGDLTKRITFREISSFLNEILSIWPIADGSRMALYESDGVRYLVPMASM